MITAGGIRELSSLRLLQSTRCPVREWLVRELACMRVVVMLNYAGKAGNSWQSFAASPDDRQRRFGDVWEVLIT